MSDFWAIILIMVGALLIGLIEVVQENGFLTMWYRRLRYRRDSSPKKIEQTQMRELERVLDEILREDKREKEISRAAHPAGKNLKKNVKPAERQSRRDQDIDSSTKEIISELTRQQRQRKSTRKDDSSGWYLQAPIIWQQQNKKDE